MKVTTRMLGKGTLFPHPKGIVRKKPLRGETFELGPMTKRGSFKSCRGRKFQTEAAVRTEG